MDVEKTSKDLVDECKVVSCEKERESGFCFQKYSKDEILEFFMVWFTHPLLSKFQKFRNSDENFDILGSFFLVYTVALSILDILDFEETS